MATDYKKGPAEMDVEQIGPRNRKLIVFTITVLFLSVYLPIHPVYASFSKRMKGISENLEKALSDVVDRVQISYSEPDLNVTYFSSTDFDPVGMGPLYNATKIIIDLIQKSQAYPEELFYIQNGNIEIGDLSQQWQRILAHYAGITAVVVIAVVFALVLPIVGLFFCCCRCAGACGARSQPFDKKHDRCKKLFLGFLLIIMITLFMFGVVCTFVSNERMKAAGEDFPDSARISLGDARLFLNTSRSHIRTLLVDNYLELRKGLLEMLNTGGAEVSEQLGEFSKAVSVTTLNTMVESLDRVRANLQNVRTVTNDLRSNASQLNDGLRRVKRELLHTLTTCEQRQCREILEKYKIGELDTSGIDFSQLPDVSDLLYRVSALIDGNIQAEVREGQKVFENIKRGIENAVNKKIPSLEKAIAHSGATIDNFYTRVDAVIESVDRAVRTDGYAIADSSEEYIDQYGIYRWYIGLAASSAFLLVLFCMAMGLLCGICGKRPDGYGDDCCNKGAGSKFLMLGVGMMFLLGSFLTVIMIIHFIVGIVAQRGVCDPLRNHENNKLFDLLDKFVDLEQELYKQNEDNSFNLSYVLTTCHQNKTIYEVLRLDKIVDLEKLMADVEHDLAEQINKVSESVDFGGGNFVILKDSAKQLLTNLSDSGLSDFPFDRFTEVLVTNMTSIDLRSLAQQLRDTADKIATRAQFASVTANLRNQALHLDSYQNSLVDPMLKEAKLLNATAIELRDGLKFNHSTFKEAVSTLIRETEEAESFLADQGPECLRNLTRTFAEKVGSVVSGYLQRLVNGANDDVGKCGPVSKLFNATLVASCDRILLPFNGFWLAEMWCLLLFIPLIVISVKLATLYQKSDPYPGPLVEAEYLYDAYADRDNIPLANAGPAEKAVKQRSTAGPGVRRARGPSPSATTTSAALPAGGGPSSATTPGTDQQRYLDMAPQHWEDYPSGGPPRYHGPAEYERPPPYYYAGPHDRQ